VFFLKSSTNPKMFPRVPNIGYLKTFNLVVDLQWTTYIVSQEIKLYFNGFPLCYYCEQSILFEIRMKIT
jgi:hypothetical protein